MQIVPLNHKVIVQSLDGKGDDIQGGIIIPETAREKSYQARVVSSDFDKVVAGDIILYSRYAGFEFEIEKQHYIVLDAEDIMCKVGA